MMELVIFTTALHSMLKVHENCGCIPAENYSSFHYMNNDRSIKGEYCNIIFSERSIVL